MVPTDRPAYLERLPRRVNGPAIATSLLVHAGLVYALGSLSHTGRAAPPIPGEPPPRVTYLDLDVSQLATDLAAGSPRGDPARPEAATESSLEAPIPSSDTAGFAPVRDPSTASAPITAASGPASATSPGTVASYFPSGFSDSRLYVDPGALRLPPSRTLRQRFDDHLEAAMRADEDSLATARRRALDARQATVLGRRVTIFGDSANSHWRQFKIGNERVILPVDGREWQDLQMKKQGDDFVRDSILRARVRSTRQRIDAERRAGRSLREDP